MNDPYFQELGSQDDFLTRLLDGPADVTAADSDCGASSAPNSMYRFFVFFFLLLLTLSGQQRGLRVPGLVQVVPPRPMPPTSAPPTPSPNPPPVPPVPLASRPNGDRAQAKVHN
ncbi:MAG TPA: hypothetical protein VGO47_11590 [Chlamydiales bacterium]|nr:hypothetical protein [Chlamydiales bacterium]